MGTTDLAAKHEAKDVAITKRTETNAMILLLSSEPIVRSVMKEILEQAGYVVLATGSFGVAVDMLTCGAIDLLIPHPYIENVPGHEAAKLMPA